MSPDNTQWPDIWDNGWSLGTNDLVLRDLAKYWSQRYDWVQTQNQLHQLEHFLGPIGGQQMLFVVYRAVSKGGQLPLLLLHGWPGSFV